MTLTTRLEVFDRDADPEALFGALRDVVGIPPEQGQTVHRFDEEILIMSEPGGYPAAVLMHLRPDPPAEHWEDDACGDPTHWDSGWHIMLSLDTAGPGRGTHEYHLFLFGRLLGRVQLPDDRWAIKTDDGRRLQRVNGVLIEVAEPEEEKGRA